MINYENIILAIYNVIMMLYSLHLFLSSFAERKMKTGIVRITATTIIFLCSLLFVKETFLNTIILFFCLLTFTTLYEMKNYNRLLYTFLFIGISSVMELVTGWCIMLTFSIDLATAKTGLYNSMGVILSKFLTVIVLFTIKRAKHNTFSGKFNKKYLPIYILPIATLFVVLFEYYAMWHFNGKGAVVIVGFLSMLLLVFSNLFLFNVIDGIYAAVKNESQLLMAKELIAQQTEQYRLLFKRNEEILKIKHDHKNFLIGVVSALSQKKYEELQSEVNKELLVINNSDSILSGNSVIDTILNYKNETAKAKGIKMEFMYKNLSSIYISDIDLSILLGNAIDNAIEATENLVEGALKVISISMLIKEQQLMITVKNNVKENLDVEHLETQKKNKGAHGFGVPNMREIARKYGGEVVLICENNIFKTVIIVNNQEVKAET